MLLVHGFPLDHTMWQKQVEDLEQDVQIIAPDLRGFGGSDVTCGKITMAQMADDLAALLDELEVDQRIVFVGLSMGGYVAWQFWQRYSERLDRLILCDTRAVADTDEVAQFRRETAEKVVAEGTAALADSMTTKLFADCTLRQRKDLVEATHRVMRATDPEGIAAALRGMAERPDMTQSLGQIEVPTLLICGQHDTISTVDEMRGIAAALPNACFAEIAGAGHMAPLENPLSVNAAIRGFLGIS